MTQVELPTEFYYRPFSLLDLIAVLQELERRVPLAQVGRAGNGIGNLCIYDGDDYIGIVELHDPPEFGLFGDTED